MIKQNVIKQAEDLAVKIRHKLELDNVPIKDIFSLLEKQGIFVVKMPIGGNGLSGAFYYDKEKNLSKILINSSRTNGHQVFTAAHEFCHFLLDKDKEIIIDDDAMRKSPIEKRADSFAANFLMPADGIAFYVKNILGKQKKLDDADIVKIKEEFGASWQAIIYRLHNLGFIFNKPLQSKLKDTGLLNSLAIQFGFKPEILKHNKEIKLPAEYYSLAFSAYFKKKISLGKLAEFLHQSSEETKDQIAEIKRMLKDEKSQK